VKVVALDTEALGPIAAHGSAGATAARIARGPTAAVTLVELGAGGRLGTHPAATEQLLVVLAGDAEVSGADGAVARVGAGAAVFWAAGEEHETTTVGGVRALVIEAPGLAHP
jgi:quercetin dioxygenase-like cupin family protein